MATIGTRASASRKRKPGASKTKTRRKKTVRGVAATASTPAVKTISGLRFKKTSCHKTKTDATKTATAKRAKGQRVRVIKSGTGYCLYSRGRATKRA